MIKVDLDSIHLFRKQNVVTLFDTEGQYDLMKCSECKIEGKCRDMRTVLIDGRVRIKAERCTRSKKEYEMDQSQLEYKYGTIIDKKCPECDEKLSMISEWTEEGKKGITDISVVCLCGYLDLIKI